MVVVARNATNLTIHLNKGFNNHREIVTRTVTDAELPLSRCCAAQLQANTIIAFCIHQWHVTSLPSHYRVMCSHSPYHTFLLYSQIPIKTSRSWLFLFSEILATPTPTPSLYVCPWVNSASTVILTSNYYFTRITDIKFQINNRSPIC